MEHTKWCENIILIDADYADRVAFDLIVNFERMLNRPISKADLAHWLVCMALDGGLRSGKNQIQVVLVHGKEKMEFDYFVPGGFKKELDGQAFNDPEMGEFMISALQTENLVSEAEFFPQVLEILLDAAEIKRLVLVPNPETYGTKVCSLLAASKDKEITLLAMEPQMGKGFFQEILGYSLMSALGIKGEELQ